MSLLSTTVLRNIHRGGTVPCFSFARVQPILHYDLKKLSTETQKSPLFTLRQRTGLAYNLCREALNKHDDDVEKAEKWLKAQSLAHGYQKATKVRGRSTREGLICLAMPPGNKFATLVELNCETDFVARNQIFKDFALELTNEIASTTNQSTSPNILNHNGTLKPVDIQLGRFEDRIVPMISKLGENIKLARGLHIEITESNDNTFIFGQIHAKSATKSFDKLGVTAGRFGALIALNSHTSLKTLQSLELVGNRLCQHVIGYSPVYIELPESLKKNLLEAERELSASKNKSEEVIDEQDTLSDSEASFIRSTNNRDDWPSLMDQTLIMSEDQIVRNYCAQNNVSVVYFGRFECGMES